jgi:mannose-6-phosphate isomerase-like protein (cupin superfamily)
MLLALVVAVGCAARTVRVVTPTSVATVDELCRSHPIAADGNIRADEIARSAGGSMHLIQVRGGEAPHRHAMHDLSVTVLRGEGILRLAGATRRLRAGDVAFVPRGAPHWFTRSGADVAVAIAVFSPPLDAPDTVPADDVDSPADAR